MSMFGEIKKTIADLPIADIYKVRLELAFDQSAALERQLSDTMMQAARLETKLEAAQRDHDSAQKELQQLKEEHAEEIRILHATEFRRGKRTGGKWMAFCPQCHMPAVSVKDDWAVRCSGRGNSCGWLSEIYGNRLQAVLAQLE
jgi:hypothetical protein